MHKEYRPVYQYLIFFLLRNIGISIGFKKLISVRLYWIWCMLCFRTSPGSRVISGQDVRKSLLHMRSVCLWPLNDCSAVSVFASFAVVQTSVCLSLSPCRFVFMALVLSHMAVLHKEDMCNYIKHAPSTNPPPPPHTHTHTHTHTLSHTHTHTHTQRLTRSLLCLDKQLSPSAPLSLSLSCSLAPATPLHPHHGHYRKWHLL